MIIFLKQYSHIFPQTRLEASETPTRSYIVNMADQEGNAQINADTENIILSEVMDAVLDDLTEG